MGCATGCAKTVLIAVNVIFFLAGAAILGGALYVRLEPKIQDYANAVGINILTEELYKAAYVLIAFGAFTLIVGFCGCYGAIKDSKCALGIYITCIVIIIGAEVGGGVFVYATKDTIMESLEKKANEFLKTDYAKDGEKTSNDAWDKAMKELKCCGVNGPIDFNNTAFSKNSREKYKVPPACCKDGKSTPACQSGAYNKTSESVYNMGCKDALTNLLSDNSVILLGIAGGVAGFELFVLLMAICVCCNIEDEDKY